MILAQLGPANALLAGMVIATIDVTTGFSGQLARYIGLPRKEDLILFFFALIAGMIAFAIWISASGDTAKLVEYVNVKDFQDHLRKNQLFLEEYRRATLVANGIIAAQLLSAGVCCFLAIKRSRSAILWIPLSLLTNVGGIAWILMRKQRS